MPRSLISSLALFSLLLSACTNVTIVRTPNASDGGQPGPELAPVMLPRCNPLSSKDGAACVYTADACDYGIARVRAERKGGKTEVIINCFIPNASTTVGDEDDI